MWSIYVGRPWSINIQDISISRPPEEMDRLRPIKWTPSSDPTECISNVAQNDAGVYDPVYACAGANVSLCEMMRRVSQTV